MPKESPPTEMALLQCADCQDDPGCHTPITCNAEAITDEPPAELVQWVEQANVEWRAACNDYLSKRVGTYEFRCRRYDAVIDKLRILKVAEWDVLYDLGAGMAEFDRCLHENDLHLRYIPVDGCIDGTDLNDWVWESTPKPGGADFFTMIEVIEHLNDPWDFLSMLKDYTSKGIVLTTPNAARVDVLAMDETHQHAIYDYQLEEAGFIVEKAQLFNDYEDTLIAWWGPSYYAE